MANASNYIENRIVDVIFRNVAFTTPATIYIALTSTTAVAGDDGTGIALGANQTHYTLNTPTGVEIAGNSYARVAFNPGSTNWANTQNSGAGVSTGSSGETQNIGAITFSAASGTWATVTGCAICTAPLTTISALTFTNGSNSITGFSSTAGLSVGDPVFLSQSTNYLSGYIASIVANTSITIVTTYGGASAQNWPTTTTSVGTLTDGGQILCSGALSVSKTVNSADVFAFAANQLTLTLS